MLFLKKVKRRMILITDIRSFQPIILVILQP